MDSKSVSQKWQSELRGKEFSEQELEMPGLQDFNSDNGEDQDARMAERRAATKVKGCLNTPELLPLDHTRQSFS